MDSGSKALRSLNQPILKELVTCLSKILLTGETRIRAVLPQLRISTIRTTNNVVMNVQMRVMIIKRLMIIKGMLAKITIKRLRKNQQKIWSLK